MSHLSINWLQFSSVLCVLYLCIYDENECAVSRFMIHFRNQWRFVGSNLVERLSPVDCFRSFNELSSDARCCK